jgi:hypothetical protein
MEVRLLGPVEVHADTGQLPVRGPIQRALVARFQDLADQGHRPPAASTAKEASG